MGVGWHHLRPFLFGKVMVRQKAVWSVIFTDDTMLCNESREQVEELGEVEECTGEKRNECQ